jgi:hypothetical protein
MLPPPPRIRAAFARSLQMRRAFLTLVAQGYRLSFEASSADHDVCART